VLLLRFEVGGPPLEIFRFVHEMKAAGIIPLESLCQPQARFGPVSEILCIHDASACASKWSRITADSERGCSRLNRKGTIKFKRDQRAWKAASAQIRPPCRRHAPAGVLLGVFAEFETNLRRERQLEGIAKAKAAGVYKGRPASIDAARVRELKADGVGPSEIAKTLKIGRASVYRVLAN
jgi:hypothetical protein